MVVCRPADPEAKGLVERANGYLETSFLPGRRFASPGDFSAQLATAGLATRWPSAATPSTQAGVLRQVRRPGAIGALAAFADLAVPRGGGCWR